MHTTTTKKAVFSEEVSNDRTTPLLFDKECQTEREHQREFGGHNRDNARKKKEEQKRKKEEKKREKRDREKDWK